MSRFLIQKAIRETLVPVTCKTVKYVQGVPEHEPDGSFESGYKEIPAGTVLVNEVAAHYIEDRLNMRKGGLIYKDRWYFKAKLAFATEVDIENLEIALCEQLSVLVQNGKYARVFLRSSEINHGPQGAKKAGSQVTLTFETKPPRN